MNPDVPPASPHPGIGFGQFVALMAAVMATNALAVDIMLPALGQISTALGLVDPNARQWIVTAYLLSFGTAQIVYGTLADRYGRRMPLTVCFMIYLLACLFAAASTSFGMMLAARVLMGVGAAGTRVIAVAVVRDCYSGRRMARVMSLTFIIFLLVPILAPSLGQLIMFVVPWRGIFVALALYAGIMLLWMRWKLPETLHPADRRPIEFASIAAGLKLTLSNRISLGYTLASTLILGSLFGFINSSQQLFADVFHESRLFTLVFALVAGCIALASLVNARLVGRLGSRLLSHAALLGFLVVAALHAGITLAGHETLLSFTLLQAVTMFCFGLLIGNFGAMSMDPLGHIAGAAAAIQGFISTVGAALIGFFIGQHFNGTAVPMTLGFAGCGTAALLVVLLAEHGRLFHARQAVMPSV